MPLKKSHIVIIVLTLLTLIFLGFVFLFKNKLTILFANNKYLNIQQKLSLIFQESKNINGISLYTLSEAPSKKVSVNNSRDLGLVNQTFSTAIEVPPEQPGMQRTIQAINVKEVIFMITNKPQPWYLFKNNGENNYYASIGLYQLSQNSILIKLHVSESVKNSEQPAHYNYLAYLSLYGLQQGWENQNSQEISLAQKALAAYNKTDGNNFWLLKIESINNE